MHIMIIYLLRIPNVPNHSHDTSLPDVNVASNTTGVRPIHDAVLNNFLIIAELLLEAGADPKLPTFAGKSPLDLSRSDEMSALLKKYMSSVLGGGVGVVPDNWETVCLIEMSDLPHVPTYLLPLEEQG